MGNDISERKERHDPDVAEQQGANSAACMGAISARERDLRPRPRCCINKELTDWKVGLVRSNAVDHHARRRDREISGRAQETRRRRRVADLPTVSRATKRGICWHCQMSRAAMNGACRSIPNGYRCGRRGRRRVHRRPITTSCPMNRTKNARRSRSWSPMLAIDFALGWHDAANVQSD